MSAPTGPSAVELVIDNVTDLGGFLDGVAEIVGGWDDENLTRLRGALVELLTQAKGAVAAVDLRLLEVLEPGQACTVAGVGKVAHGFTSKARHQGGRLARVIAARVADTAVDVETGEVIPPAVLCERTADELVAVFGLDNASHEFRAGEVKKRRLVPGHYTEWDDRTAKIDWQAG